MRSLRAFIHDHRRLAIVLVGLALCMKMMVPAGFMVGGAGKSLAITICNGRGYDLVEQVNLPPTGKHDKTAEQGKAPDACPYSALNATALAGAPLVLLLAVLAFIVARSVRPAAPLRIARRAFLRPPLRAPPVRR